MKKLLTVIVGVMIAGSVVAGNRPFQLSLTPDVAIFDRTERINGLTLSVWGENPQTALSLGIVNGSIGDSAGASLGLLINYADNYKGLQWAPVNYTKGDFLGWQGGLVNYTGGRMSGLQSGAVNYAGRLSGLQLGFVNYAASASAGLQIGVVNLIPDNPWFSGLPGEFAPGMVFVNWRF